MRSGENACHSESGRRVLKNEEADWLKALCFRGRVLDPVGVSEGGCLILFCEWRYY